MTPDLALGVALAVVLGVTLLRTRPGAVEESPSPSTAETAPAFLIEDLEYSHLDHLDLDHRGLGIRSSLEADR